LLVTRTSFFNDMRSLLKFIWFKNWSDFFSFIVREYIPFNKVNSG
ncbi:ISNCY family transposase, partial [Dolichospermum sp. UHCC 0259]|nr:ISNCY family transposase [Dolichospermum sp. UHCC 0259]